MAVKVREWKDAWWIFIDHQGHRKAKRIGEGRSGRRAAEQADEKISARLVLGEFHLDESRIPTLHEYAERWLQSSAQSHKLRTQENYSQRLHTVWLPALGSRRLDQITRVHVKKILTDKLAAGYKVNAVLQILTPLRSCLSEAVADELIPSNPAGRQGRLFRGQRQSDPVDVFAEAELVRLFETAQEICPQAFPMVFILARTGLRSGEMLALQVHDLDFTTQQLWVRRTWGSRNTSRGEQCINAPKSGKLRLVDMSQQLCEVLQGYIEAMRPKLWLFPGKDVLPIHPATFREYWLKIMTYVGLPYRKPHALRHTYASLLIAQGEHPMYIRDQLGHSSIKITIDTYGHLMTPGKQTAVDRLDDPTIRNPYATRGLRLAGGGQLYLLIRQLIYLPHIGAPCTSKSSVQETRY